MQAIQYIGLVAADAANKNSEMTPTSNIMRRAFVFILALLWIIDLGFTQEQPVLSIRILPEDVIPESIQEVQLATNKFLVVWTYTDAGAKRMLAFWEAHEGERACTQVGSYASPPTFNPLRPRLPDSADSIDYAAWKETWLKRPKDKF